MSFPILSTKLYIPPRRERAIARPRLAEKLLAGVERPGSFLLLSGPAGFGKTTLLSEFVARLQHPAAWLSLDEGDNEPRRFWTYLVSACQARLGGVGEAALDLLRAPQPQPEDAIPTLLINDLAGQERPLVLVLDDFHAIQNAAIHAGLLFLLDHLPANLRLILSTRADPPLPLARFRARHQLVEIRAQDLRFRTIEAAEFLSHTMGLDLPAEDIAALEERTEGWVAGLQLAALSMQGREDHRAFIHAFSGSHAYVAEFLIDEVLGRQPKDAQDFLLQTAILDRLNADLCEAVTGCQDGQERLKSLQQANSFLVPLDEAGRWFRYHHLFADLLQARLRGSYSKAAIDALHRRAADWYEQSGMTAEAISHALAAEDYPRAVGLVEQIALPMILQASVRMVEGWLLAIPAEYSDHSPRLNMAYAWLNLLRGTPHQAAGSIERLRAIFAAPEAGRLDASLRAEWLAIQAELRLAQGQPEASRDLAVQAQSLLPEVDPLARSMISMTLAKAYQQTLDYERAAQVFQMIVQDARSSGDIPHEILGTAGAAQMYLKQGRLRRGYEVAGEAVERMERSGRKVPFGATLYGELGQVNFEWGKFDLVRTYLQRSIEMSGKSGYSDPEIYFHLMQSKICLIGGDLEGAEHEMQRATHLAEILPPALVREHVIAQQVMVDLALDRPAAAESLLAAEGFHFGESLGFPELAPGAPVALEAGLLFNSALRVLLYHARKQTGPARLAAGIALAGRVLAGELLRQHLPVALETLLLRSQMHAAAGDRLRSQADAAQALALAGPEGFVSVFLQEGQPVAEILSALWKAGLPESVRPDYARELLAAFPGASQTRNAPGKSAAAAPRAVGGSKPEIDPLVEPLTARELVVLRRIADGESNQAIADRLVITLSAVKKHTGNIYGKLGVNSRMQAVSRARQLGLLSPDE
jgi:LuxR family maltose regulon positive regulatory protein